jgi:hypothetical protein
MKTARRSGRRVGSHSFSLLLAFPPRNRVSELSLRVYEGEKCEICERPEEKSGRIGNPLDR